jgi:hypothetical protein
MKKLPAVARVRVSLNEGLTILDLKPGNTIRLAELRRIIKDNGFVSKDATVVARGSLTPDQKAIVISGSNEQLTVKSPPQQQGDEWRVMIAAESGRP